jgi:phage terminase large subunit GpA-like protein
VDAVLEAFSESFRPPDRMPIYEWANKYIYLPNMYAVPGPFHVEKSFYLKEPLVALQDPDIREVTIYKAVQTGGSLVSEIWVSWLIDNAPGPTMWNMQTDEDAKQAAEMRINPLFESCPPVRNKLPLQRFKRTKTEVYFYNMWLLIQGAGLSNIQSKSVQNLINDEIWIWPPGNHGQACKRVTAFGETSKILNISQGGTVGDEMDVAYSRGTQEEWGFHCPKCRTLQQYVWKQMEWDDNEITHPGSTWNFIELEKTIRFKCIQCPHVIRDTPHERRELNDRGGRIIKNPGAPKSKRSFRWTAMAFDAIRWSTLVEEWIHAQIMMKNGSIQALQEFIQKRLAEPWEDRGDSDMVEIKSDYSIGEEWGEEDQRFLTVDVQKDHFWAVCRAWSKEGTSRLIWCGKLLTFEEIHEKEIELKVTPRRVIPDSGFRATEVYEACCKYGWTAFKGEDKEYFSHKLPDGTMVRKIFSPVQRGDPGIGTSSQGLKHCALILWSNPSTKDMLERLKKGRGPYWGIPKDVGQEYLYQIDSETKRLRHNKMTGQAIWEWVRIGKRPNHYWDCECEQVVAAVMAELLARKQETK